MPSRAYEPSAASHVVRLFQALLACACLVIAGANAGAAQPEALRFQSLDTHASLGPYVFWLFEEGQPLSPAEAASRFEAGHFARNQDEWAELGMRDGVLWVAVLIENATPRENLFIEFRNPRMSYIDMFAPDGSGGWQEFKNGSVRPYSERLIQHPMPSFPIQLAQGETGLYLFRLENVGDFRFRAWLWAPEAFVGHVSSAYYAEIVTIGGLGVLALLQLLVFISLRQAAYFYLSLFITAWLLFFMAGNGTGAGLLWGEFSWFALRVNSFFAMLMNATFILFTLSYLEARKHLPRVYWAGILLAAASLVHLVYCCFYDDIVRVAVNRFLTLATLGYVAVLAALLIYRGSRQARFFLATWIFMLTGGLLMLMLTWYVVSAAWLLGTPVINLLFTVSILLWSFELTGRVKIRAQEQRRMLEEEVRRRTHQLETALSEVKTLSGLLPICSHCKKIRDDKGYWNSVEQYVCTHTDAAFTHGICPECVDELYPDIAKKRSQREPVFIEHAEPV